VVVYNKCDLLEASRRPRQSVDWLERQAGQRVRRVFVSARDGTGLEELRQVLGEAVAERLNAPGGPASTAAEVRALPIVSGISLSSSTHDHA
jgi:50S ribosomal subunit-associated GTPase HflX